MLGLRRQSFGEFPNSSPFLPGRGLPSFCLNVIRGPAELNIIRVQHDKDCPFLIIAKRTVTDHSVGLEARGFLAFLLTKPDEWRLRPEKLAQECGISVATVYRLLKTLIDARYVKRDDFRRRADDGRYQQGSLYTVFEVKQEVERKAKDRGLDSVPF